MSRLESVGAEERQVGRTDQCSWSSWVWRRVNEGGYSVVQSSFDEKTGEASFGSASGMKG